MSPSAHPTTCAMWGWHFFSNGPCRFPLHLNLQAGGLGLESGRFPVLVGTSKKGNQLTAPETGGTISRPFAPTRGRRHRVDLQFHIFLVSSARLLTHSNRRKAASSRVSCLRRRRPSRRRPNGCESSSGAYSWPRGAHRPPRRTTCSSRGGPYRHLLPAAAGRPCGLPPRSVTWP